MAVYVVIGGNRGLGLEAVAQLLSSDSKATVVATARAPEQAEDLQKLIKQYDGRLKAFKLDASSDASIKVILPGHAEVTHALTKASFVALSPVKTHSTPIQYVVVPYIADCKCSQFYLTSQNRSCAGGCKCDWQRIIRRDRRADL